MKRLHLLFIALVLLCTACNRKEHVTLEPLAQKVRLVAQITEGDYCTKYSYDSEGLLTAINEETNNADAISYTFHLTPIIYIGEVSNPTGTTQDPASTSELEFTEEGYLQREVAKNSENGATLRTVAYSYDDEGYLTEITQTEVDRKYTRQMEWSEGNLICIKNEYFFKTMQYSFYEDITFTYNDDIAEPTNHNSQLYLGDKMPIYPTEWYGSPSKNHIASMHAKQYNFNIDGTEYATENTLNFSYEYDSKGYPTAVSVHDANNDTTHSKEIEYAN